MSKTTFDADRDLYSGLIRLHILQHAAEGPIFGLEKFASVYYRSMKGGGGRVVRYTPDGRVDRAVALPCAQVTCCAFGGARLDRLFITTAGAGLDAAALAREPHAGALFVVDAGVGGLADTPFPAARLPFSV